MNEKALHTLEYDKIIEKLVGYAVSPMAKERAAALRPSAAMSDIIIWQEETTEATTMVLKKGTPSFGGFREIRPQLKRASMAGILSIAELMSVGEFAYVCRKVKNYARKENKDEVYARLDEYFDLITPLDKLENEISRCILSETEVADIVASSKCARNAAWNFIADDSSQIPSAVAKTSPNSYSVMI